MIDLQKYELKKWPKPPMKICENILCKVLGLVSPSLLFHYLFAQDRDVIEWCFNMKRYKLYKRQLNKNEYKNFIRELKTRENVKYILDN